MSSPPASPAPPDPDPMRRAVRLAVVGCGHGTLDAIYASVAHAARVRGWRTGADLVLICGDFQAVRNAADLSTMAVPAKYRQLGDFPAYYAGQRRAPYPTIFVGGNHEASGHLAELHHGGWVAPDVYYLGAAGVVRFGGLRLAGASGIWKGRDYRRPHAERLPYRDGDIRSIYHIRELDVRRLLQLRTPVDVGVSHDWPRGIEWRGDARGLFRAKPFLEADARAGELGSPAAWYLLQHLRPPHWFAAHLHCKYAALVDWAKEGAASDRPERTAEAAGAAPAANGVPANADEIDVDMESDKEGPPADGPRQEASSAAANADEIDVGLDSASDSGTKAGEGARPAQQPPEEPHPTEQPAAGVPDELRAQLPESFRRPARPTPAEPAAIATDITNTRTKFLALDKCLPKRGFLQLLEIQPGADAHRIPRPKNGFSQLSYDKEWLAITRVFAREQAISRDAAVAPDRGAAHYRPLIEAEEAWVAEHLTGRMRIPANFVRTAPPHGPAASHAGMPEEYRNPQTDAFCQLLGIKHPFDTVT